MIFELVNQTQIKEALAVSGTNSESFFYHTLSLIVLVCTISVGDIALQMEDNQSSAILAV